MKFISEFLNKKKKINIFNTEDSYRLISYTSEDKKIVEKIYNKTNLEAPNRIKSKDGTYYLYKIYQHSEPMVKYEVPIGHRFFRYKTKKEIFAQKYPILKVTWANNIQHCNNQYKTFQNYLESVLNINNFHKKIITLDIKTK